MAGTNKELTCSNLHDEFYLFETIRLESGIYFLLDRHLERLFNSAKYFEFNFDNISVTELLKKYRLENFNGIYKVKLSLSKNGEVSISGEIYKELPKIPLPFSFATSPISKENIFIYHKTTNRLIYEEHQKLKGNKFDVLLWNSDGELTEFTIGNLVIEINSKFLTPPVESGLLPGTLRGDLLSKQLIHEQILTRKHLEMASNIWLINSLRGWVKVYHSV